MFSFGSCNWFDYGNLLSLKYGLFKLLLKMFSSLKRKRIFRVVCSVRKLYNFCLEENNSFPSNNKKQYLRPLEGDCNSRGWVVY